MPSRYVVAVQSPDERRPTIRTFGPWLDYVAACLWAEKVNDHAEAMGGGLGRAYVLRLRERRLRDACAWIEGETV